MKLIVDLEEMSDEKGFGCFWNAARSNKNVSVGTLPEKE